MPNAARGRNSRCTAVLARIVDEGEYADIGVTQGVSEAVVRQRVSRGLAGLRRQWEKRV